MESVIGSGIKFRQQSTGGFWYWDVIGNNITGGGQYYQIDNIQTPFGRLVDAAVAIPSDVITAMADSVVQVQQQFAPLVAFVQPYSPYVNLTVTEGDASIAAGVIPVQNIGAFGSFMTVTATNDAAWLSTSPSTVAGIGRGEQASLSASVSPSVLLAINSPYTGHINVQDNRVPATVLPVTYTLTVLPRPSIATSTDSMAFVYSLTTHSYSGAQQLIVSNNGPTGSVLNFSVAKVQNNSAWLTFTPTNGGPLNPSQTGIVTVSIVASNIPFMTGVYAETIRVASSNASNSPVDISVTISVVP